LKANLFADTFLNRISKPPAGKQKWWPDLLASEQAGPTTEEQPNLGVAMKTDKDVESRKSSLSFA
jgi:hypothetical protein